MNFPIDFNSATRVPEVRKPAGHQARYGEFTACPKDVGDGDGVLCCEGVEPRVDEGPSELAVVVSELQKREAECESEELLRFRNCSERGRGEVAKTRVLDEGGFHSFGLIRRAFTLPTVSVAPDSPHEFPLGRKSEGRGR